MRLRKLVHLLCTRTDPDTISPVQTCANTSPRIHALKEEGQKAVAHCEPDMDLSVTHTVSLDPSILSCLWHHKLRELYSVFFGLNLFI